MADVLRERINQRLEEIKATQWHHCLTEDEVVDVAVRVFEEEYEKEKKRIARELDITFADFKQAWKDEQSEKLRVLWDKINDMDEILNWYHKRGGLLPYDWGEYFSPKWFALKKEVSVLLEGGKEKQRKTVDMEPMILQRENFRLELRGLRDKITPKNIWWKVKAFLQSSEGKNYKKHDFICKAAVEQALMHADEEFGVLLNDKEVKENGCGDLPSS